jgi:hypothetical protein
MPPVAEAEHTLLAVLEHVALVGRVLAAMVVKTAPMQPTELQILDQAVEVTALTLVETYKDPLALAVVV